LAKTERIEVIFSELICRLSALLMAEEIADVSNAFEKSPLSGRTTV
jgi:hypothetical protein